MKSQLIKPVLLFATDSQQLADRHAIGKSQLWTAGDRFASVILDRAALERAYGPSLWAEGRFHRGIEG